MEKWLPDFMDFFFPFTVFNIQSKKISCFFFSFGGRKIHHLGQHSGSQELNLATYLSFWCEKLKFSSPRTCQGPLLRPHSGVLPPAHRWHGTGTACTGFPRGLTRKGTDFLHAPGLAEGGLRDPAALPLPPAARGRLLPPGGAGPRAAAGCWLPGLAAALHRITAQSETLALKSQGFPDPAAWVQTAVFSRPCPFADM